MSEMTKYARVSRVEDFFKVLLTKYGVSENIFVSRLPVTIKSSWNDMVLIDVGKGVNRNAYRSFSVNIFLYGRPIGSLQQKNVKVIDAMGQKLLTAITECHDNHYHPVTSWSDSDYDTTRNFHYNVLNFQVLVND